MAHAKFSVIVPVWNRLELMTHYFQELESGST
jgi:hypothetical protein